MKKLRALAFYALVTPALALGSSTLLASHHSSSNPDLGEQDMDEHAKPESGTPEQHEGAKKSKYNKTDTAGTNNQKESGDHSDMKKKDDMKSSGMSSEE